MLCLCLVRISKYSAASYCVYRLCKSYLIIIIIFNFPCVFIVCIYMSYLIMHNYNNSAFDVLFLFFPVNVRNRSSYIGLNCTCNTTKEVCV